MSADRTVRLELIHGRRVHDTEGRLAGRIQEVKAERVGDECLVREFHLGTAALLERLGITLGALTGLPMRHQPLRVAWQDLDLSDPERPRLRCRLDEVKRAR